MVIKWENFQWVLTIATVLKDAAELFGKAHAAIPEDFRQKMPGWFGLTLADERIFNAVVAQLTPEQQLIIMRFLQEKCKDYERNRFINIVAGMEVKPGSAAESEIKWDAKSGAKIFEKTKAGSPGLDCRKKFLESFADAIENQFAGDFDKAYAYCIGGRMILPDPIFQTALKAFSESVGKFKNFVLAPLGVSSIAELTKKVSGGISHVADEAMGKLEAAAKKRSDEFEKRPFWKKLFLN